MKNAQEARMAMESFDPDTLPGYSKVEKEIERAIRDNKSSAYLDFSIDDRLGIYLKSKGYKVEFVNDKNEVFTVIIW